MIDTQHLIDIGTRVLPWLWAGWWGVLHDRLERNAEASIAEEVLKNPRMKDLTFGGVIVKALARLTNDNMPQAMGEGFLRSEILRKARSSLPKSMRGAEGSPLLEKELARVVEDGLVVQASKIDA